MFDCLALGIEHARLQCDVNFGFHSINVSPAIGGRPAFASRVGMQNAEYYAKTLRLS